MLFDSVRIKELKFYMTETFLMFAFQDLIFSEVFFTLSTFICQRFINSKVCIIFHGLDLSS